MPDLSFKITTSAELAGAKAVEQQLEREIGKAKALGKEYGHLSDQLKRVKEVTATFTDTTKQETEATDKAATAKANLTRSIQLMSRYIPGLNYLVLGLKNGWLLLGAAAVAAMSAISRKIDELNAKVAQSIFFTAWENLDKRFVNLKVRGEEMAEAFKKSLKAMEDQAKKTADQIAFDLERIEKAAQYETKTLDLEEKKAIEAAKARGASPEEQEEIRAGFRERKLGVEQRATIGRAEARARGAVAQEESARQIRDQIAKLGDLGKHRRDLALLTGPSGAAQTGALSTEGQAELREAAGIEAEYQDIPMDSVSQAIMRRTIPISYYQMLFRRSKAARLRRSGQSKLEQSEQRSLHAQAIERRIAEIQGLTGQAEKLEAASGATFDALGREGEFTGSDFQGQRINIGQENAVGRMQARAGMLNWTVGQIGDQGTNDPQTLAAIATIGRLRTELSGLTEAILTDMYASSEEIKILKEQIKNQR